MPLITHASTTDSLAPANGISLRDAGGGGWDGGVGRGRGRGMEGRAKLGVPGWRTE